MKKDTELEIFALCERLTELLGDKEAIADLKKLYDRHPEMFKDMQEVSQIIKEVVSEPEIIIKNPSPKSEKDYIAGKKLNDKKMGEVGVRQDENIVKIFHANEKRIGEFYRLKKRENLLQVETPTPSTRQLNGLGLIDENLSGANALSATDSDIIPQEVNEIFHANEKNVKKLKQLDKKEVVYKQPMVGTPTSYTQAQSLDERLVDNNISSTAKDIIPHYPLTQEELQRRLDINLNNHRRVSDEKQKQEYLERANAIKEQAKKQHIALDSKSLKALEKANLIKSNTNIKER